MTKKRTAKRFRQENWDRLNCQTKKADHEFEVKPDTTYGRGMVVLCHLCGLVVVFTRNIDPWTTTRLPALVGYRITLPDGRTLLKKKSARQLSKSLFEYLDRRYEQIGEPKPMRPRRVALQALRDELWAIGELEVLEPETVHR